MAQLPAFLIVVAAMVTPHVLAAALAAAFPGLRRGIGRTSSAGPRGR